MGNIERPRFVRAIKKTLEQIRVEALYYGYRKDPEYLKVKEFLEQTIVENTVSKEEFKRDFDALTEKIENGHGPVTVCGEDGNCIVVVALRDYNRAIGEGRRET